MNKLGISHPWMRLVVPCEIAVIRVIDILKRMGLDESSAKSVAVWYASLLRGVERYGDAVLAVAAVMRGTIVAPVFANSITRSMWMKIVKMRRMGILANREPTMRERSEFKDLLRACAVALSSNKTVSTVYKGVEVAIKPGSIEGLPMWMLELAMMFVVPRRNPCDPPPCLGYSNICLSKSSCRRAVSLLRHMRVLRRCGSGIVIRDADTVVRLARVLESRRRRVEELERCREDMQRAIDEFDAVALAEVATRCAPLISRSICIIMDRYRVLLTRRRLRRMLRDVLEVALSGKLVSGTEAAWIKKAAAKIDDSSKLERLAELVRALEG